MNRWQTREVLVAENNDDDFFILYRSFQETTGRLYRVHDGEQAIEYLSGLGRFCDRQMYPLPQALLLDLKLRGKNGFEVLQWIRGHSALRTLIVVILTASSDPEDIRRAYDLRANSYLIKPSFERYAAMARVFEAFWLKINHPPVLPLTDEERQGRELTFVRRYWNTAET